MVEIVAAEERRHEAQSTGVRTDFRAAPDRRILLGIDRPGLGVDLDGGEGAVPLSEHEQRLLDQIERGLHAEAPKLAAMMHMTDNRGIARRRIIRGAIGLIFGLLILLGGVNLNQVLIGVLGFVLMLVSVVAIGRNYQRMHGGGPSSDAPRTQRRRGHRLEERWQRRMDERDGNV